MDNWRNEPATEKQLEYIAYIQEFAYIDVPLFNGKTKGEASDYIDKYREYAHYDWNSPVAGY